ncbi:hypothetical protein ACTVNG_00810 [Serratia ureilytica]|uniref:hypothetical protein n=1 Tax=Serratia ureilytica TaxID=300181 RepID=UPI0038BFD9B2
MAIDIIVDAKRVNFVEIGGNYYYQCLKISLSSIELTESVNAKAIVSEYSNNQLLRAIGESKVAEWLSEQGYSVSIGDAL